MRNCLLASLAAFVALSSVVLGQQGETIAGDGVLTVTPIFTKLSPSDTEWDFDLNFFRPRNLPQPDGVVTQRCPITAATYLFKAADGKQHVAALREKDMTRTSTDRIFWMESRWVQCLDQIGECTDTGGGRSSLVWRDTLPNLHQIGRHSLVISGTLYDSKPSAPNITFQSNEAVWTVDASVIPLAELKAKAQKAVETDVGHSASSIPWEASETPGGNRVIRGRIKDSDLSPDRLREAHQSHEGAAYAGVYYEFVFTAEGRLLKTSHKTRWLEE